MAFAVDELVDVRATDALAWRAGTGVAADVGAAGGCYEVELDTPITAADWSGVTRKYGGDELVGGPSNPVFVFEHVNQLAPGELIRVQGG